MIRAELLGISIFEGRGQSAGRGVEMETSVEL